MPPSGTAATSSNWGGGQLNAWGRLGANCVGDPVMVAGCCVLAVGGAHAAPLSRPDLVARYLISLRERGVW